MPRVTARLVVSYVGAVGLPLLLLAGVFHAGRDLRAPMHTAGAWTVESGPMCGASVFTVAQSGTMLHLTLAGHAVNGTLDGDTVRMEASQPDCRFTLVARLDRQVEPHVLAGQFDTRSCASCPAQPFRAVRVNADRRR